MAHRAISSPRSNCIALGRASKRAQPRPANLEIDQTFRSPEAKPLGVSYGLSVISMATARPPDDGKTTPERPGQSDQPLMEERRTIIAEYASRLKEILKLLRKRLH
jgi:hypothetical protein